MTGIPPYKSPVEQGVRCPKCERRYIVFVGDGSELDTLSCEVARDKARRLNAYFVDARIIRVLNCLDCGFVFDLMPDEVTTMVQ